ncbi:EpsG family protein [Ornithobacterium rhinotracheale]|uniref:EpsG family protein n=1 Tax=Ornithobacterium rhinotracheale TaxID=28251 RepID=UPI00129D04C8|nr:EpsG family protein [Ornithobacterium rhinotracheale]MRI62407.1 EpsG family protein [Ornithobacterium rhinotracheale]
MLPYILIFLLAILMLISNNKLFRVLLLGSMIFMCGFRDMIGGFDVYIYSEVYEVLKGDFLFTYKAFEKGFLVYYWILQKVSYSREFMLFATTFVIFGGMALILKKLSPIYSVSLFMFFSKFFMFTFTYIRQETAMLVVATSLLFFLSNIRYKYIWGTILILLAGTIHRSALVFLVIPIIRDRKLSQIQYIFFSLILLVIVASPLGNLLLSSIAESADNEKLNIYMEKENNFNFLYLIEGGTLLFLISNYRKHFQSSFDNFIINGTFAYTLITLISITNASLLRLTWYFYIFIILFIPTLIIKVPKIKNLALIILISYFALLFFRYILTYGPGEFYPYKSIFQDFNRNGRWEWMEYR